MTEYLTSENLAEIANDRSNIVLCSVQYLAESQTKHISTKKGHGFYCCISKQVLESYF